MATNSRTHSIHRAARSQGATSASTGASAPAATAERGAGGAVRFEQTRLLNDCVVDTGGFTEIATHAVFKAVGRTAGLELDPSVRHHSREGDRIEVDGCFRTALPGIYAGGDCVAPRLEAEHARRHGRQAAHAIHADLQA